ncbi:MAG: hypothetical protein SPL02_01635 [Bacilli bacterium]|nr:hypothetical protein [Bacilli bacterium]MDY6430660.1 hypothetical protein [Bacilli bacterium]
MKKINSYLLILSSIALLASCSQKKSSSTSSSVESSVSSESLVISESFESSESEPEVSETEESETKSAISETEEESETHETELSIEESSEKLSSTEGSSLPKENLEVTVASPKGAPAVGLYNHVFEDNVEVNDPTNVQAWLLAGNKDVVIAPTNAGCNLISKKNVSYKLAAILTFGNFYLVSTGNDENDTLDADDPIFIFQTATDIPAKLFSYVYSEMNFTNIYYGGDNSNAARNLILGYDELDEDNAPLDYVLVAEPALSNALSKNKNAKVVGNIQELYKTKSGGKMITQASVFVHKDLEKEKADKFLSTLEFEVNYLLDNPLIIDEIFTSYEDLQVAAKLGANKELLKTVLKENSLGLGFKNAKENKESVDSFLETIGFSATSEEIYY